MATAAPPPARDETNPRSRRAGYAEATRRAVLDAARDLFVRQGDFGTKVEDRTGRRFTPIIPTGSTLNVKDAFVSEEHPEYDGSAFNDVMAILVNGIWSD
ncbi:choice-of-anchor L domain-containing protein [Actinoplanes sp. NEAU-A12]|uniref:Choice-of-anchor L domain-containing protein n=1 Tax=Actinoplanes sandaracinus TaxID=3045177 RepID=A0ABT6WL12_9ACTN|nr:choice-of-anchor L domain-containing protein [Actinoplanes sandaracinus]MDI6100414.1 choice-of-anchor L domain-containing protein [Actinoplanes sandaracinus]